MLIEARDISKVFKQAIKGPGLSGAMKHIIRPQYRFKEAVKNVSISIEEGEAVAYVGPNGAGKSTTIKMLIGIIQPTSGFVQVCGISPSQKRIQNAKNIGVVFGQRTQLWWDIPIIETYSLLKDLYEIPKEEYKKRLYYLSEILDMSDFMYQPTRKLSLGQRMRAELVASLLHQPRVLFLDEPTIGLDIMAKKKIREFIKEINKTYRTTVMLTTHDLDDIEEICKRIVIINKGEIIYDDDLEHVKNKYARDRIIYLEIMDEFNIEDCILQQYSNIRYELFDHHHVKIEFDRFEQSASELINAISSKYNIVDFRIDEPKIEDVITKMYSGRL